MILIIAEKAIAGRRIAAILSGKELPGTKTGFATRFDFEMDNKQYSVVPLSGHIVDVDFPTSYKHWLGTDLRKLVDAPIEYNETRQSIAELLKKIAPSVKDVIIATDSDREGEAIGLEALNIIKSANPNVSVKRANFSAITERDIKQAFKKLGKLDFNLAESANSRREIDLVWGAVLTRFLSLVSGRLGKQFLSTGRVQGPTLALIVEREKQRLAFVSKKYWQLQAQFEKANSKFTALHKEGKFWEESKAKAAMKCREPPIGTVTKVQKKRKTLARPLPFNTTAFLRAATAIGFTASRAMQIAESLYQSGFISYPRTDNSVYPASLDLRATLKELAKLSLFSQLAEQLLQKPKLEASAGKAAKDHPPIHPVSAVSKGKLDQQHWRIYELVCRRFMATLAEDALTENLSVEINLNKQPFVATGQTYLRKGWKQFYPYSKATEIVLPALNEGDKVKLLSLDMLASETKSPARYSQGALIKAMSDLNLGTKSTRAETIQKLYSRNYIEGQKAITPTKIAIAVIDSLQKHDSAVVKPQMTANLEQEMDSVANGEKSKETVVVESKRFLSGALQPLLDSRNEIGSTIRAAARADSIAGPCPGKDCKGELIVRRGKTGKRFLGCTAYPKCTVTFPLPQKGKITFLPENCADCQNLMIYVLGKRYRYKMCIDPKCKSKENWGKKTKQEKAPEKGKAGKEEPSEKGKKGKPGKQSLKGKEKEKRESKTKAQPKN